MRVPLCKPRQPHLDSMVETTTLFVPTPASIARWSRSTSECLLSHFSRARHHLLSGSPLPGTLKCVILAQEGKLIDGTKFDSSYDRGRPTTFAPNQVVVGPNGDRSLASTFFWLGSNQHAFRPVPPLPF